MKLCKANDEGTPCDQPVTGGGRCKYHQLPEHERRHIRRSMKSTKASKYRHLREAGRLLTLLLPVLTSCGINHYQNRAQATGDRVQWERCESYRETVWSPWNNRPGEQDSIMNLIKQNHK